MWTQLLRSPHCACSPNNGMTKQVATWPEITTRLDSQTSWTMPALTVLSEEQLRRARLFHFVVENNTRTAPAGQLSQQTRTKEGLPFLLVAFLFSLSPPCLPYRHSYNESNFGAAPALSFFLFFFFFRRISRQTSWYIVIVKGSAKLTLFFFFAILRLRCLWNVFSLPEKCI